MKRWTILSVLAVLFLALLFEAPGTAAAPQAASGTFAISGQTPVDIQISGGNFLLTVDETIAVSGDFEGTLAVRSVYHFHPNGRFTSRSEGTFSGSLFGGPHGTLTYSSAGRGEWTLQDGNPVPATFEGQNALRGTGGGLTGLKGQGSFDAPGYTEFVHFAP